jgi:glycosyltransferase involved in cell wall biosynthesis
MPGLVPQAEVAREMARARVVVVPVRRTAMTLRHTSPLKAFEAMAAGRPLVMSDLPSSREIVREGETALLAPPGDAPALAAALLRLLNQPDLARRLSRNAWREAAAFSWDVRGARLRALFDELRG